MKYDNDELRNKLAGEYVLGTLHGHARARFESLLKYDANLRRIVTDWQQKLGPMSEAIKPVQPPKRVWKAIEQRLDFENTSPYAFIRQLWSHLFVWRSFSMMASAVILSLVVYLSAYSPKPVVINQYVAVMTNSNKQVSWMITTNTFDQTAIVKVLNTQSLPDNKAFELWMLPNGQQPISMGLLSASEDRTLNINNDLILKLIREKALAVSLEPSGGSPTGQPTGPVLYQGKLQSI